MMEINLSEFILRKLIVHSQTVPLYYWAMTEALHRFNLFGKFFISLSNDFYDRIF